MASSIEFGVHKAAEVIFGRFVGLPVSGFQSRVWPVAEPVEKTREAARGSCCRDPVPEETYCPTLIDDRGILAAAAEQGACGVTATTIWRSDHEST